MKFDLKSNSLIEISSEWVDKLIDFGCHNHPELLPNYGSYGRANLRASIDSLNKLAYLYFKEIFKAI